MVGLGERCLCLCASGEIRNGTGSRIDFQLVAFIEAVRTGSPLPTGGEDAVLTMQLIDDVYRAAGLPVRGAETE